MQFQNCFKTITNFNSRKKIQLKSIKVGITKPPPTLNVLVPLLEAFQAFPAIISYSRLNISLGQFSQSITWFTPKWMIFCNKVLQFLSTHTSPPLNNSAFIHNRFRARWAIISIQLSGGNASPTTIFPALEIRIAIRIWVWRVGGHVPCRQFTAYRIFVTRVYSENESSNCNIVVARARPPQQSAVGQ